MVFDINLWMEKYVQTIQELFGNRLMFAGLQGSYGRDEATEDSDIDVVLILDEVTAQDLKAYDEAISELPHRDKVCGFISGRRELMRWDKSDLFQFCHDTTPVFGGIDSLFPMIGREDVRHAILAGACNIYHLCGHNLVHEKDSEILKSLYKAAVFVTQAIYYERVGTYIKRKADLLPALPPREQQILEAYAKLKGQRPIRNMEFEQLSGRLFVWAGQVIREYGDDS